MSKKDRLDRLRLDESSWDCGWRVEASWILWPRMSGRAVPLATWAPGCHNAKGMLMPAKGSRRERRPEGRKSVGFDTKEEAAGMPA